MIPVLRPDLPNADEILPWLRRIDEEQWYTNFGPLAEELEQRLRPFFFQQGTLPPVALVSSGTAALRLALLSWDLPIGSRVLLPAFTFPASAAALLSCGLEPVLGDVDPFSWSLTPDIARATLSHCSFDAVMPVATYGCPQNTQAWDDFSEETGIPIVLDAAGAFGAQRGARRFPVTLSLHATKAFGIGEGGAVVCDTVERYERIRALSNFGFVDGVILPPAGTNAKLSEYHAAVGLAQLCRWPRMRDRMTQRWSHFRNALKELAPAVSLQTGSGNRPHTMMPVLLPPQHDASDVALRLRERGVATRHWYCPPLDEHPAFSKSVRVAPDGTSDLQVTRRLGKAIIGLPFHHEVTPRLIRHVCQQLTAAMQGAANSDASHRSTAATNYGPAQPAARMGFA